MQPRVTTSTLIKMKKEGKKIAALTAYDFPFAGYLDKAGIDIVLVGDSLGMVVQGKENTLSVVLEGIPSPISTRITQALNIPTIGIGAGPGCDGQILVLHDMLGINDRFLPKFVKKYADIAQIATQGLASYIKEVKEGTFPSDAYEYK